MGDARRFTVLADGTERLDRFLADQLQLSRTQAARLVADRRVAVNGVVARASRVLARGDAVLVTMPELEPPREIRPADIPLQVVFEDEHLAVIDKPAGLVVHPAPGHWDDTLVNALVARGTTLSGGAAGRPGIVHRLDRDTSGLMLVAKTDLAHRRLGHMLGEHRIRRVYAALAWGHLDESPTIIDAPLARHPADRKRVAVISTGRTHQIRVHLAHIGHPVIADPVYGAGGSRRISGAARAIAEAVERACPRQALHAAQLSFRHPVSGDAMEFTSEWPADLQPALVRAAGDAISVALSAPLRYLLFFNRDG